MMLIFPVGGGEWEFFYVKNWNEKNLKSILRNKIQYAGT